MNVDPTMLSFQEIKAPEDDQEMSRIVKRKHWSSISSKLYCSSIKYSACPDMRWMLH